MDSLTPMKCAIYCRISADREGRELGVERQEQDCRELAARLGYTVFDVYVDNDISASTRSKKRRPNYDRMLADAAAGRVQVIIGYTTGRVTRRPRENEDLIELAETCGTKFAYFRSPSFDLNTAAGRRIARMLAANDAGEAEDIQERVVRAFQQRRELGLPSGGKRVFGYLKADPTKEIQHNAVIDPVAEKALLKARDIVFAGGTLTSIRNAWNADGVPTPSGGTWKYITNVKRAILNPRIAGLVAHNDEIVGEGKWPRIWDRKTYEALIQAVDTPPSATGRGKARGKKVARPRKHVLSGFVFCECGHRMGAHDSSPNGYPAYARYLCVKATGGCGKVTRNKAWLEAAVDAYVVARIEAEFEAPDEDLGQHERALVAQHISAAEGEIQRLRDAYQAGIFTMAEVSESIVPLRERVNELKGQQASMTRAAHVPSMEARDAVRLWRSANLDLLGQRQQLLSGYVQRVIVKPLPSRQGWGARRALPPDCIEIIPAK